MIQIGNIVLEDKCPTCGGKGWIGTCPQFDSLLCRDCDDDGVILTEDGKAMKKFIEKYIGKSITIQFND